MPNSVTVFISYAQEDLPSRHNQEVLDFANRLRDNGINAALDQYETAPSEGWPLWMEKQIRDADYVLMVCTQAYNRRVIAQEPPGKGLGVRWEGNLIYNHLYQDGVINDKFIPIIFNGLSTSVIPTPVRNTTYYRLPEQYELLYRRLTAQPLVVKPTLGAALTLPPRQANASAPVEDNPQFLLRDIYTYAEDLHYPPRNGPHYPKHLLDASAIALSFTIANGSSSVLRIQSIFLQVIEAPSYRLSTFPAYGLGGNGAEPIISWVEIKPHIGIYKVETERRSIVGSGIEPADYHIRVFCEEGYKYRLTLQIDWLDVNNQNHSGRHEFENIIVLEVPTIVEWTELAAHATHIKAFFEGDGKPLASEFKVLKSHPQYTILDPSQYFEQENSLDNPNVIYAPSFSETDAEALVRYIGGSVEHARVQRFMLIDGKLLLLEAKVLEAEIINDMERIKPIEAMFDALVDKYKK